MLYAVVSPAGVTYDLFGSPSAALQEARRLGRELRAYFRVKVVRDA